MEENLENNRKRKAEDIAEDALEGRENNDNSENPDEKNDEKNEELESKDNNVDARVTSSEKNDNTDDDVTQDAGGGKDQETPMNMDVDRPSDNKTDDEDEAVASAAAAAAAATATMTTTTTTTTTTENGNEEVEEAAAVAKDYTEEKVAVTTGEQPAPPSKNPYDNLRWTIVKNDGKPESMIKLVGLKSLFAKQLPKMPRAYIARLVFDKRHVSLAILSDDPEVKDSDEEIIGGICFRPFEEMRFAEIAFCAVSASHQVKGYGTKLMNLVKQHGAQQGIEYFITYADNYAIGYFKKQGFSKSIAMPKGRYMGLIKDYDGGTMMECYVHPSIDFTRIPEMIKAQRAFILERVRLKANSHKVYNPLPKNFTPNIEGVSRVNESAARAMAIPGMAAAGWTLADLMSNPGQGKETDRKKDALKTDLLAIVRKIEEQQFAWPFREPVDTNEVADYLDVVKEPIDLSTIEKRIKKGDHYKSKKMLYSDLMLMVNNCKMYNDEGSTYVDCANNLESFLSNVFVEL